jgi:thioredoxin 1
MASSSPGKWPALAAIGLLVAAGAWVVCKATPVCYLDFRTHQELPGSTSTLGEENMFATHTKSHVPHASEANFHQLVLESDVPVLVDFYADWCGPCQRLAPILEELAVELPHARIVKVNVDDNPNLAAEYDVESIPNIKIFKNGSITHQLVGLADKNRLQAMLTP